MSQTVSKHPAPGNPKLAGSLTKIERDLKAYQLHLAGCTVRGVCEEIGYKSTQSGWAAIERGKKYAIERGIPVEERRIEIDQMIRETIGHLAKTIRHQSEHGCETFFVDQDGKESMQRRVGVDPRIAGELSRSLNRWAEYLGLLDRAPEAVGEVSTSVVFVNPASDGAVWDAQTVNVTPQNSSDAHEMPTNQQGSAQMPASKAMSHSTPRLDSQSEGQE